MVAEELEEEEVEILPVLVPCCGDPIGKGVGEGAWLAPRRKAS